MAELSRIDNPAIRPFFDGPRGRAAAPQEQRQPGHQGVEASSKPR